MFITVKIRSLAKPAIAVFAAVLFVAAVFLAFPGESAGVLAPYNCRTLLIDAGHGGVDGGAVSAEGVKESDVNLAIALRMSGLCDLVGIGHQLTRESDVGCLESESYSEHDDLVARAQMANSIPECVLISVHQNKYPSDIVRGAEIMYAQKQGAWRYHAEQHGLGVRSGKQASCTQCTESASAYIERQLPGHIGRVRFYVKPTGGRTPCRRELSNKNSYDAYCVIHSI